ncbi:MAG: hypothetical protein BWY09_02223 [Candidatus Hydrogenedentes bacterium ADurb.Bin179]|nr:MAG: hypothetical protein BWY09_02223 [Candidatus Hydrogenedentes bacterium ADurb.Bin179]
MPVHARTGLCSTPAGTGNGDGQGFEFLTGSRLVPEDRSHFFMPVHGDFDGIISAAGITRPADKPLVGIGKRLGRQVHCCAWNEKKDTCIGKNKPLTLPVHLQFIIVFRREQYHQKQQQPEKQHKAGTSRQYAIFPVFGHVRLLRSDKTAPLR